MATWMSQMSLTLDLLNLGSFRLVDAQRATRRAPSQLLPVLASLCDDGLAEVMKGAHLRGKTYAATPKGKAALSKIEEVLRMMQEQSPQGADGRLAELTQAQPRVGHG